METGTTCLLFSGFESITVAPTLVAAAVMVRLLAVWLGWKMNVAVADAPAASGPTVLHE